MKNGNESSNAINFFKDTDAAVMTIRPKTTSAD